MTKVFIDGSAGTTGLKIVDRLKERADITLITLPDAVRKDINARAEALNSADIAFLCLPDQAAIEAAMLVNNPNTAIIDTSTAHRTTEGWAYGFPELTGYRERIKNSKRIANPGCHASGFIALVAPLVERGVIKSDTLLSAFSLTGYTGGGKKMIEEYETDKPVLYGAPRQYALGQSHKHLPEMKKVCSLDFAPAFCPIVGDFPRGMEVTVPLHLRETGATIEDIKNIYKTYYTGKIVRYSDETENGFMSAAAMANRDGMLITVTGNDERALLISRFDNLGKGASGAAIQNMNTYLGVDETTGLDL